MLSCGWTRAQGWRKRNNAGRRENERVPAKEETKETRATGGGQMKIRGEDVTFHEEDLKFHVTVNGQLFKADSVNGLGRMVDNYLKSPPQQAMRLGYSLSSGEVQKFQLVVSNERLYRLREDGKRKRVDESRSSLTKTSTTRRWLWKSSIRF